MSAPLRAGFEAPPFMVAGRAVPVMDPGAASCEPAVDRRAPMADAVPAVAGWCAALPWAGIDGRDAGGELATAGEAAWVCTVAPVRPRITVPATGAMTSAATSAPAASLLARFHT